MSYKVGKVFVSIQEEDNVCELCRKVAETRPYGKNGKEICFECSEKPENKETVEKNMTDIILGRKEMPRRKRKTTPTSLSINAGYT